MMRPTPRRCSTPSIKLRRGCAPHPTRALRGALAPGAVDDSPEGAARALHAECLACVQVIAVAGPEEVEATTRVEHVLVVVDDDIAATHDLELLDAFDAVVQFEELNQFRETATP